MPLQRQIVTLPLALGVDTKTDAKQVALGKLVALENGVFGTLKQLRKRNGYSALPRRVMTASGYSRLDSAYALTSYRDELVAVGATDSAPTAERLFSYSDGSTQWVDKGAFTTCAVGLEQVARGTVARTGVDGTTTASGLQVYAWEEAGSVRYAVRDTVSGQLVVASALVAASASKPRVVPFVGGALIYYVGTGDSVLYVRSLLAALGATLTPASALTTTLPGTVDTLSTTAANRCYDVALFGVQLLLGFVNDVGSVTVRRYDSSSAIVNAAQELVTASAVPTVLALATDSTSADVLLLLGLGASVETTRTDALLTTPFSTPTAFLSAGAGSVFSQLAVVAVPTAPDSTRFRIWATATVTASGRYTTTVLHADGVTVAAAQTTLSLALASKPWLYAGRAFVLLVFVSRTTGSPSGLQNQLLVVSDSTDGFDPVARLLYTSAAGVPTTAVGGAPMLPSATDVGNDLVRIATLESATLEAPVGDVQTVSGVVGVELDFSSAPLVDNRSELGESLVLGGGFLSQYDGVGPVELGFFLWPDECTVALGGSGGLSAGAYQWVAVYEWTDNAGLVHRSAASLPAQATATAGQAATLTVSTLPLTRKQARSPVQIVLYRTLANGTVFYRASSLTAPDQNVTATYLQTVTDTVDDTTLAKRPFLYSTGGVVENVPPGAVDGLAVHRGRLWCVDATNRLRLWFSRQVQAGAPVEMSDVLYFDVDARGGDVVALASLDDKLIVFKKTQIFMVSGQGPDATGSQNDFSDSVLVTTDVGCLDARSVVTTPAGLIFQSAKGLYLLDRSLAVSYVGADVEAYNGATVESSQLIPTANQVRFVLSTGVALVYDYLVGQWSVFTNHPAVDSVVWLGTFCWLRSDGVAMREDSTRFDDDGHFVSLRFTTGWLSFSADAGAYVAATGNRAPATLQSYQRARRLLVLGEYEGSHRLRVRVAYDYDNAPMQDVTITPAEPPTYGEGPTYGDETPFGGAWQLYQWRVDLARQKCQAVQVTISDERSDNVGSEGVRLSALAVELGLKPGTTRVPVDHVVG